MALLTITPDEPSLVTASAERITVLTNEAIQSFGSATLCLTGGHTPRPVYEALADPARPWRNQIDWARVHLFWGDDRHVGPESPDSNFRMANGALVAHVPVPPSQVHRMRGEMTDATAAASLYEDTVRTAFAALGRSRVQFDVMLLGMGEDVHIASLFPGSPLLTTFADSDAIALRADEGQLVAGVWVEHLNTWRITLTPPPILDARAILMMVDGAAKAEPVLTALNAPVDVVRYPAHMLRGAGDRVEWLMDAPAAARLPHAPRG